MTEFIHEKIELPWGTLNLDGNSKITCELGTYDRPVANAFSLPHISTCPGSTPACRAGCYVHGLEKHANDLYQLYRQNETTIHATLLVPSRKWVAAEALAMYLYRNKITRFRWHVSGDVFSARYAEWIAMACEASPGTQFWIYTRSFAASIFAPLVSVGNLTVNVSADADNLDRAWQYAGRYGLNLCYYAREGEFVPPDADVIFPDYPLRGRSSSRPTNHPWWQGLTILQKRKVCPPDFFGQSESLRCGPCKKCL